MPRRKRIEYGWMVVFRPDPEVDTEGMIGDEAFTVIYKRLNRAEEECSKYLKKVLDDEPDMSFVIDWAEDSSSTDAQRVRFGRPRDAVDGMFYLYEMQIEP